MLSRLLAIPPEVCVKILKELLCNRDGVHLKQQTPWESSVVVQPTPSPVYPAILACCHQLLQRGFELSHSSVSGGFRKLQVNIKVGENYGDVGSDFESIYDAVAKVRTQGECADLCVDIRNLAGEHAVINSSEPFMTEEPEETLPGEYEVIVRPFGLLRRLERVQFVGSIPRVCTEMLVKTMLGDAPIFDVPALYRALQNWVWENAREYFIDRSEHPWDDSMRKVDYAALTMDVDKFCRCRKQVIKDFYEEYNVNRLEIYEKDPDPGAAKYEALADDIEMAEEDRKLLLVAKVNEMNSHRA